MSTFRHKLLELLKPYQLMEEQYDELCEMIRGSSPNWTHKETLDRCAAQVDALIAAENPDKYEISQHQRDWMDKHTND